MSLKTSCGAWLAVYLAAAVAIGVIVYHRLPQIGAAVGGGMIGGAVAWMGIAYLTGIATKIGAARRLAAADEAEPPRDGARAAVVGSVETTSAALASPISGIECAAYKYEVRRGEELLYEGMALTPSVVRTSRGTIRLLACPDLQVKQRQVFRGDALPSFSEYVAKTSFREPSLSDVFTRLKELFNDDDGSIRVDTRLTHDDAQLKHASFVEWTVAPGDRVCVEGRYSAERGAFVPDDDAVPPLVISDPAAAAAPLRHAVVGVIGALMGAAIFLGIVAAALTGFLALVPLDASEQMAPALNASWPEIRLERLIDRTLRPRLRRADLLDSGVATVMIPRGVAHGRVVAAGGERTVSRAAFTREDGTTTIHIDDDAVALTLDAKSRPLRLRIGVRDVAAAPADLDLTITDSSDDAIAGRLTYFHDTAAAPACHVTFNASAPSR